MTYLSNLFPDRRDFSSTAKQERAMRDMQLVADYQGGRTLRYLAMRNGVSDTRIRNILLRLGVKLRRQGTPGNHEG